MNEEPKPLYASPEIIDYLRELCIRQNEWHTPRELEIPFKALPLLFKGRKIEPYPKPESDE